MRWLTAPLRVARDALFGTFRPAVDATPRVIRLNGAVSVGLGLALFLAGGALMFVLARHLAPSLVMKIALAPLLVAYALVIVGGYRVLTGREPAGESSSTLASIRRITIGVVAVVLVLFGQIFNRAATMHAVAVRLATTLARAMPVAKRVTVPVYGTAYRVDTQALRVPARGPLVLGGRTKQALELPAEMRWKVSGVDSWSPQLRA